MGEMMSGGMMGGGFGSGLGSFGLVGDLIGLLLSLIVIVGIVVLVIWAARRFSSNRQSSGLYGQTPYEEVGQLDLRSTSTMQPPNSEKVLILRGGSSSALPKRDILSHFNCLHLTKPSNCS